MNAETPRCSRPRSPTGWDSQTAMAAAAPHPQSRRWPRSRPCPAPESESPSPQIPDSFATAAAQIAHPASPSPREIPPLHGSAPSAASHCQTAAPPHSAQPPASSPPPQTPSPPARDETPSPRRVRCGTASGPSRIESLFMNRGSGFIYASCASLSTRPMASIICSNCDTSTPNCLRPAAVSV